MNIADLKLMDKEFITPNDVGKILGCNPHLIRIQARETPWRLGFPVVLVGNRTKIPRRAFIRYMETLDGVPEDPRKRRAANDRTGTRTVA